MAARAAPAGRRGALRRPLLTERAQEALTAYAFLAPFLFGLVVFFAYAFVRTVYFSFTRYDLFHPPQWVGLDNYLAIFQEPRFLTALANSLTFAAVVTTAQTVFALMLALVLNQKLKGITFFRAAYYMPSVTSSIVITLIFIWLFQRTGVMNYLLTLAATYWQMLLAFLALTALVQAALVIAERRRHLPASVLEPSLLVVAMMVAAAATAGLAAAGVVRAFPRQEPVIITWLNTRRRFPDWGAPIPLEAIMMLNTWTTAPTFMLLYLAGLQDIPRELYEAASVDGATPWQQFRHITVPQLRHVSFLVVTLGLIGTLQMFDQVAIIGDQAPLESVITLAYYVYNNVFPGGALPRIGAASAGAVILAVLTLVVVLIQRKVVER
ncbi:sugar ABC transporter permease [Carboxydochorda subterranea]|uniref:Sugar ABC transporter permease n=1 Tax=Carboxydichorda subterranea TaxID=3109565 RepID=A0ABZ1BU57_9FIRM|nr:sugar ABC transporter permease [Limnochorda sp. L945t]WRP16332.1 sugar ABC transporter permease [Limnochorda sp. L945t]